MIYTVLVLSRKKLGLHKRGTGTGGGVHFMRNPFSNGCFPLMTFMLLLFVILLLL